MRERLETLEKKIESVQKTGSLKKGALEEVQKTLIMLKEVEAISGVSMLQVGLRAPGA